MDYSNDEILKRVENAKQNSKALTHITNKSTLSTEDQMKISFCTHFVRFATEKRIKLKDLSKMLDIPTTRLSEIMNYKIEKFTVDKLVMNLKVLASHEPRIREYLIFLNQR